jgi:hypothetical protein
LFSAGQIRKKIFSEAEDLLSSSVSFERCFHLVWNSKLAFLQCFKDDALAGFCICIVPLKNPLSSIIFCTEHIFFSGCV